MKGTKQAIYEAAVSLAAERGITGTTMDEVAVRAGVAKGSLYYNFASKDKLFESVLIDGLNELIEHIHHAREGSSGEEGVRAVIDTILIGMHDKPDLAKIMVAEIFRDDRSWVQVLARLRTRFFDEFKHSWTGTAQSTGATDPVASVRAASVMGATLMGGLEWLLSAPGVPRSEVVDAVMAFFAPLPSPMAPLPSPKIGRQLDGHSG